MFKRILQLQEKNQSRKKKKIYGLLKRDSEIAFQINNIGRPESKT